MQYAISTGYSKTDTAKIFNDTWSDIWYEEYYVDLFYVMKTLLDRKGIVKLKELKVEYAQRGYEKQYSSIVPKEIYEKLYLNFRQNLYIGENGKIIQGKADEEWGREIDRNKDYIKWIKKYNSSPSKINNLALMAVWCVMVY